MVETARLVLRHWRDDDLAPFAALNADPEVMAFFPKPLTRDESDATVERFQAGIEEDGHGFWAVEVRGGAPLIGFVGIRAVSADYHFAPAWEVGWRLGREHWGRGYATEAGAASVAYGFDELGLEEVVALAVAVNVRSLRVMERIGMAYDEGGDFDHWAFPEGHPYRRHVLYRIRKASGRPAPG